MMERIQSSSEALEKIHDFLQGSYWPAHLSIGDEFRVIADDLDSRDQIIPFVIRIASKSTVELETVAQIPNKNPTRGGNHWISQLYRATIHQIEHPLVFRALLAMTLAFRIDQGFGFPQQRKELQRTRSPKLHAIYQLLNGFPWLKTLNANFGSYLIPGDSSPWPDKPHDCQLGVLITECNDTWLQIGYPSGRVRSAFGGGVLPSTYSALFMLAEAIRLEQEGR